MCNFHTHYRYEKIDALKLQNPELKVLVSIGGWISEDEPTRTREFRLTAHSAANRVTFIQNAIKYMRDRNLDGLDIDWEYPRPDDPYLQLMKVKKYFLQKKIYVKVLYKFRTFSASTRKRYNNKISKSRPR